MKKESAVEIHGKIRTYENVDYPFFHTEGLNTFLHPELVAVFLPYQVAKALLTRMVGQVTKRGSYLEQTGEMEFRDWKLKWVTSERTQTIVFFPADRDLSEVVKLYQRPSEPSKRMEM